MISKTEFIQRAMALQPPAVKPKKKGWPITCGLALWFCGVILLILEIFYLSNISSDSQTKLNLLNVMIGVIFFLSFYSIFWKEHKAGRSRFKVPFLWLDFFVIVSLVIAYCCILILILKMESLNENLLFGTGFGLIFGFILIWSLYSRSEIRHQQLFDRALSYPFYRILYLLGFHFKKTPEKIGLFDCITRVFMADVDTGKFTFSLRCGSVSRYFKFKVPGDLLGNYGGIEIVLATGTSRQPLTSEQALQINKFFNSLAGQMLLAREKPRKLIEDIQEKRHIVLLTASDNSQLVAKWFPYREHYLLPEDLPIIYDDVAAFYQTLEEIAHG